MTLEEITYKHAGVRAEEDCKALFGKYIQLHMECRTKEIAKMFARRGDSTLEMPWGCYDGFEGIMKCFVVDHTDIFSKNGKEKLAGTFFRPFISTPVIEVAGDRMTARGRMICYGQETFGTWNGVEKYRNQSLWYAGFLAIDFIFEDGEWKFWHMLYSPAFLAPHETMSTEWETEDARRSERFYREPYTHEDRPTVHPVFNWSKEAVYGDYAPEMPAPYDTFDDVAPGYGYVIT